MNTQELETNGVPIEEVILCPGCANQIDPWLVDPGNPRCHNCGASLINPEVF
jgi:hypothetical protein